LNFWFRQQIKLHPELSGIEAGGEGVAISGFFLLFIGALLLAVNIGFAVFKTRELKFQLVLCVLIIVETFLVFNLH
jgi:hypothetical protein